MENKITYIDTGLQDMSRPSERPKKTNWRMELMKKYLLLYQFVAPQAVAEIIWKYFTRPVRARFKEKQLDLLRKAETKNTLYKSKKVVTYKWGTSGPKILLSHGWNSKIADFRRMIEQLVKAGYVVEGIDMPAHGKSEGTNTALPEFRDIQKAHIEENGPYHAVIGYSLGGIAAGIVQSELDENLRTPTLFIIAAPPYVRYFFEDIVRGDLHLSKRVYHLFCKLTEVNYHQNVDYFDLRTKTEELKDTDIHLIYDENDLTVPFEKGTEMRAAFPDSIWVHTKGLGHYLVIAHEEVIKYIRSVISSKEVPENVR